MKDFWTAERLRALNTLTKYPSIPTYHALDRGRPSDELNCAFNADDELFFTEKVDGTNARIVFFSDGSWFIGSRQDLLTYRDDLIRPNTMNIVETVLADAQRLGDNSADMFDYGADMVVYGEVYGHGIGKNGKQYASGANRSFRVFDVQTLPKNWPDMLEQPLEELATWRDAGEQNWMREELLLTYCRNAELLRVPRIFIFDPLPTKPADIYTWLRVHLPETQVRIDPDAPGFAEGLVVRNNKRSRIAKIRFDDYRKVR